MSRVRKDWSAADQQELLGLQPSSSAYFRLLRMSRANRNLGMGGVDFRKWRSMCSNRPASAWHLRHPAKWAIRPGKV